MTHFSSTPTGDISLTRLRELNLDSPAQAGRPSHLSAASGLVRLDDALYVVADDEVHLGVFDLQSQAPGRLLRLRAASLDLEPKARKRMKPDFEALVHVAGTAKHPNGGLLALGSGSRNQRVAATWVEFDERGHIATPPRTFDLAPLYDAVTRIVGEVNIEGAVIHDRELRLFQRGNKGRGVNAVIGFEWSIVAMALSEGGLSREPTASFVDEYDLGSIDGVPLGFSDAAGLPDGSCAFAAIAEDTSDAYADGACAGATIGLLDAHGSIVLQRRVRERAKIEGIHAEARARQLDLLLVTDADDARIPAELFSATLRLS
jgi:hypothetical protein